MAVPRTTWLFRPELHGIPNEGTLSLTEADGVLSFEGVNGRGFAIELASIRRVKRLRGSPVLKVAYRNETGQRRLAFYYFTSPPEVGSWRGGPISREERKGRRKGFSWLGERSSELRGLLDGWVREIRAAARGG